MPPAPKKASGPEGEGLGRSRGGFSTKIHLRANGLGLPVAVVLTGGEANDVKGYKPLMAEDGGCQIVCVSVVEGPILKKGFCDDEDDQA